MPTPVDDVGAPPVDRDSCVGRYDWARERGGIDSDATTVRITVEGLTDALLRIDGIEIRVLETEAPAIGTHITPARPVDGRF